MICAADAASATAPVYATEIDLGHALFEDRRLSVDRSIACASCHAKENAFADGRKISVGIHSRQGTRNAPSLLAIGSYTTYFWDGRVSTLEDQALFPLTSDSEMGLSDPAEVVSRIREDDSYEQSFKVVYGVTSASLQFADIARAIVAYERSLAAEPIALDSYLSGNMATLSAEERYGLALFTGKADCSNCHRLSANAAPLTDNDYHGSGIGMPAIAQKLGELVQRLTRVSAAERYQEAQTDADVAALGRFLVTLDPKDIGKFRTPSLRNVARTAPYMHDGSIDTLERAIDIELYYHGLDLGYPIILSDVEKHALTAFLRSLSTSESSRGSEHLIHGD
jgi:cytochrome c peroxidase